MTTKPIPIPNWRVFFPTWADLRQRREWRRMVKQAKQERGLP